jgi:hypothetical protein
MSDDPLAVGVRTITKIQKQTGADYLALIGADAPIIGAVDFRENIHFLNIEAKGWDEALNTSVPGRNIYLLSPKFCGKLKQYTSLAEFKATVVLKSIDFCGDQLPKYRYYVTDRNKNLNKLLEMIWTAKKQNTFTFRDVTQAVLKKQIQSMPKY